MKAILFFLVWLILSRETFARNCRDLLDLIAKYNRTESFAVAIDFDGTAVDTDLFLEKVVIPQVIEKIFPELSLDGREAFSNFLQRLQNDELIYPASYSVDDWQNPNWNFPVSHLPRSQPKLMDFWKSMREIFKTQVAEGLTIPFIPTFIDFYDQMNSRFLNHLDWVVITARTDDHLQNIQSHLAKLKPSFRPIEVVTRGKTPGQSSAENGELKRKQIENYKTDSGRRIKVLIENDSEVLSEFERHSSNALLLFQMKKLKGSFEIEPFRSPGF